MENPTNLKDKDQLEMDVVKTLSRRFYEAYDRNDRLALAQLLAPDCRVHMPGMAGPLGRGAFLEVSAAFADAFSDSETTFEEQIAERNVAVTRWSWSITHTQAFQAIPATGRRVTLHGMTVNRFAHGLIVEQWVSFDQLSLLQQLGAAPRPS